MKRAKRAKRKPRSQAERNFELAWRMRPLAGVELQSEFRFHPTRQWRFDFAWPAYRLALEIDGRGRHQTVDGVRKDFEKNNAAVELRWRILRFPATDKKNASDWVRTVQRALAALPLVTDACAACGCTEEDCSQCVERTGEPCYWVSPGLCSACKN